MKIPTIKWIPFDSENVPELCPDGIYLILLREDNYDNGKTWSYSVDIASPYGNYLSNFWNTNNDWYEGQIIEVLAYADLPYGLSEEELTDIKEMEKVEQERDAIEYETHLAYKQGRNDAISSVWKKAIAKYDEVLSLEELDEILDEVLKEGAE